MVESPAYAGAQVLAVRDDDTAYEVLSPLQATPVLDSLRDDPIFEWAASRLNSR
jgi:hypothetical protein